jgi:hypothetical protein
MVAALSAKRYRAGDLVGAGTHEAFAIVGDAASQPSTCNPGCHRSILQCVCKFVGMRKSNSLIDAIWKKTLVLRAAGEFGFSGGTDFCIQRLNTVKK